MCKTFYYEYTPIIIGAAQRYKVILPVDASPIPYKTLTTGMRVWNGQVVKSQQGRATALVRDAGRLVEIEGQMVQFVKSGDPCVVMEHLNINGEMGLMIGIDNILMGDVNFINFGVPGGRHLRIDAYTGDNRIIE